jgi:hypothetical protein
MRITAPAVHVLFTSITGPLTLELDTRTVATAGVKVRRDAGGGAGESGL